MKKRILSLFLVTVMVLSTFAIIPVTAAENTFNASDASPVITTLADLEAFDAAIEGGNAFSGKTVKLNGDITLPSTFTGIGANSGGAKGFGGIFDGQGHTITMSGHGKSSSWTGALFTFTENNGASATFKNLKIDGTMKVTSNGTNEGTAVLLGRPLTKELIIENVYISVDVELATNVNGFGAFVYDLRGATQYDNVTIKGCVYDGTINCKNQAQSISGFIGSIGATWSGTPTKNVTIQDCVYAGTIKFADTSVSKNSGAFVGSIGEDSGNKVTVKDCYSIGTMYFGSAFDTASEQVNGIVFGSAGAAAKLSVENIYYVDIAKSNKNGVMGICGAGSVDSQTQFVAKTKAEIMALTANAFSANSTMTVKSADEDYAYYPAPAGLVQSGWIPSLMVSLKNTFNANDETPIITSLEDLEAFDAAIEGGNFFTGKTVKLNGDIVLPSTFSGIGIDKNGAKGFGGIFDGQGHTITMSGHGKSGSWTGALFTFTESGGASATIKNLNVDGKMKITSNGADAGSSVLLGRPLTSEVIIENVYISVDVELATNIDTFGVFIYDLRGGNKYTNVSIKGCVYDGTIACRNQASYISTFIGNVQGDQSKSITIQDCIYAGVMRFYDASVSRYSGTFIGDVKSNDDTTLTIKDCYSIGTMEFVGSGTPSNDNNGVIFGNVASSDLRVTNFYYVNIAKLGKTEAMAINGTGTVGTKNNVVAKTKQEIAALTSAAFSANSTMTISTARVDGVSLYYPAPAGLVADGWIPSLAVITDAAAVLGAQIRCTEAGDQYSGIRFVSVFNKDMVEGAQTNDANFGIILIAKNKLSAVQGSVTIDSLVAAGAITVQATKADDSVEGYYRVNAVVYEIAAENYKDEIVAYVYVGDELVGESVTRSIYNVAEACLNDANATAAQKAFCQTIVGVNN